LLHSIPSPPPHLKRGMADPAYGPSPCPSKVAEATLTIVRSGHYRVISDEEAAATVKFEPFSRLQQAGKTMRTYCTPHSALPPPQQGSEAPQMTLFQGDSFDAASWLMDSAPNAAKAGEPCVLDFASDSEPGGGWKGKQRGTQEEDLCRRSSLGACLEEHYNKVGAAAYMPNFSVVYAPDVTVFRAAKSYRLLERPFWVAIVAAALRCTQSDDDFRSKINGVLRVAGNHGHRLLVLGAWGCGAFGNEAGQVAQHLATAVKACGHWFDHVVFAVPRGDNLDAFRAALPTCSQVAARDTGQLGRPTHVSSRYKWSILALVPDALEAAVAELAPEPASCRSKQGAQQLAQGLLAAVRSRCIRQLAEDVSEEVVARLAVVLPSPPVASWAPPADTSPEERDISAAFLEDVQARITRFVKDQRSAVAHHAEG